MRYILVAAVWLSAAVLLIGQQSKSNALGLSREVAAALEQPSALATGSITPSAGGARGMQDAPAGAPVSQPLALGPKAPGRIRIGIAPAQAQMGQGNNVEVNYGTSVRNAIVVMMNGPAVEIAALDASLPIQVQAEAKQKECDYILLSAVAVKRTGGGLGKFVKAGNVAANFSPIGVINRTTTSTTGVIAAEEATFATRQAMSELSGFNSQIKSKDEVTVTYQLVPTGQSQPKLENSLKGKSKSDGEDVLSPLIQQAANSVLTEVTKK